MTKEESENIEVFGRRFGGEKLGGRPLVISGVEK